jgi:catechol 2,3-dioxygenase-like lactoylglutathione lyase family enzyme
MEHIGINTGNFKESLKFYRDILGLKEQATIKMPEFSVTYLGLPDSGRVELFDYGIRQERVESDDSRVGYRHIAFESDNLETWEQHLKKNGIKIILVTTDIIDLGVKVLLFEDPDGTPIEICKAL